MNSTLDEALNSWPRCGFVQDLFNNKLRGKLEKHAKCLQLRRCQTVQGCATLGSSSRVLAALRLCITSCRRISCNLCLQARDMMIIPKKLIERALTQSLRCAAGWQLNIIAVLVDHLADRFCSSCLHTCRLLESARHDLPFGITSKRHNA